MSNTNNNEYLGRFLKASELLQNKGIRCIAWEEWEKASTSLPKLGQKRYEPNGSWLENNAIQNGINMRKDLLNLEKVDRISNLATAEWLSYQKRAKVIKKSGQDWSNFGHVINSELYLIPEEALLLLEMNSLELYWNGVPLSIQQAYDILFDSCDDGDYTLDHYRVYRHLVKEGYHLQRYIKKSSSDSRHSVGKKVIVEPENGLRMTKATPISVDVEMEDVSNKNSVKQIENTNFNRNDTNGNSESTPTHKNKEMAGEDKETENTSNDQCLNEISKMEVCEDINDTQNKEESNTLNNKTACSEMEDKKKKVKSNKIEIISDEIVLDNIQIATNANKWPGSRIQRNVKLMPKRINKNILMNNTESKDITVVNSIERNAKRGDKRNANYENQSNKKLREEVIDISDDEDKDVQRPLTRMEILNQLPNIAANPVTVVKINRGYIPHSIKPQKDVYYFRKSKWMHNQNNSETSSSKAVVPYKDNSQQLVTNVFNPRMNRPQHNYGVLQQQFNRFAQQTQHWFNRNTYYQQNISHFNQRHSFNYQSTFNYNIFFGVMQNVMRSIHMSVRYRNPFQTAVQQNVHFSYQQNMQHAYYNTRSSYNWRPQINSNHVNFHRNSRKSSDIVDITRNDEVNAPSFNKLPNVSSWAELKEKWLEEKTITIDDEEPSDVDGEVQVLKQSVKPLLKVSGPVNFGEIYEKLRIIKPVLDVSVRKKSSDYTLSYNVYLSSQPYKKANPGVPVYRILVIRARNSQHMNFKKLSRLQQEMKEVPIIIAYVSNTITYVQPGFVSMQNWY